VFLQFIPNFWDRKKEKEQGKWVNYLLTVP
jgi:hypothetical protein